MVSPGRASRAVDALGAQLHGGGVDDLDFLAADLAIFACVRVDAAQADARALHAEGLVEIVVNDGADFDDEVGGKGFHHAGERTVDGGERNAQAAADEHHYGARSLAANGGKFGEVFGVARMLEARAIEQRLGDGVGDDACCLSRVCAPRRGGWTR